MEPAYLPMVDDDVDETFLLSGSRVKVVELKPAWRFGVHANLLTGDGTTAAICSLPISVFGWFCLEKLSVNSFEFKHRNRNPVYIYGHFCSVFCCMWLKFKTFVASAFCFAVLNQ